MRFCPFCSAENADELAVCQACGRRLPPLPPRRARNAPASGVQLPPRSPAGQPPAPPIRRPGTTSPPPASAPGASGSAAAAAGGAAPGVAPGTGPGQPAQVMPPGVMATSPGFAPVPSGPTGSSGLRGPAPAAAASPATSAIRETSTGLPPPPAEPGAAAGGDAGAAGARAARGLERGPAPNDGAGAAGAGGTKAPRGLERGEPGSGDARGLAVALSPGPAAQRRELPPAEPEPGTPGRRRADQPAAPTTATLPRAMPSVLGSAPRPAPATAPSVASPAPPVGPAVRAEAPPRAIAPAAPAIVPAPPVLPPHAPGDPPWATAGGLTIDAGRRRDDGIEPPPTRIQRPEALVDRPFTPPKVSQIPEIPEPGLFNSARYTVRFARARWQRRGAIKLLGADIKKDTDALDQVLGALGAVARTAKVDGRVFSGENAAINAAEERVAQLTREHDDVDARKAEENSKFVDVERERNTKLGEAERMVDEVHKELAGLEAQRRGLRDKRKELERRQKAYLKAAEDNDRQSGSVELGDQRQELRRGAEQHRREAAALEPERQDVDRRLAAIERPIGEANAKLDAAKAELDAAKRSLADAREGHTHRLAELDAEQKRKAREIAQAEGEIARRLVTLGTLVNLNRIEDPQFGELYQRIDRLRGAITARTTEIERLTAEREAYDRGNLVRGLSAIGGAILIFIALIVILRAVLR